jgi:hypothetical protein
MVFQPGQSGNPKGRHKNPQAELLREALLKDQELNGGEHFVAYCVKKARKDTPMAIAILKKILPDLEHYDIEFTDEISERINDLVAKLASKGGRINPTGTEASSTGSVSG